MASRNVKLKIETQLQKKALDDAVKGIRNVDKAMEKSGKTSVKMADEGVKANKRNSYAAGQAAMQLQDVAVQAQMGTDSMRILGQQGPQLLSAFGPKGMLAGLAVAVGAGLVSAFRQPKKEAGELIEEIERLVNIGKEIASLHADNLTDSLAATIERANQAKDAFTEMMEAREQGEQKAISATDSLIEAELTLKKLRGEDVSLEEEQLKAQQEQRKIEEERNKASTALAQRQKEEKDRVQEITEQLKIQRDLIIAQRIELEGTRQVEQEQLSVQSEALEKLGTRFGFGGFTPTKGQEKRLEEAQRAVFEAGNTVEEAENELRKLSREQDNLNAQLRDAQEKVAETARTIEGDLANIDLAATAQSVTASGGSMGKQLDILAEALEEGAAAIGAGAPKDVMARLQSILEDGIQTDELGELVQVTSQLGIKLNQGFGAQNQTMKEILGQLELQANQARELEVKVQNLKSQRQTAIPR